jgi:dTDP-glucose 4,6-dehydratase
MKKTFKKRTIVTGGAGFIGSNYLNYAVTRYPDELFINVDMLTYSADPKNVEVDTAPNYVFEKGDICDATFMANVFEKYKPQGIIHFAAESHVDQSILNPSTFDRTNVVGTNVLAYLAREHNLSTFYFISTDEVYGSLGLKDAPCTEESPIAPRNPYSASKASAELFLLSFKHTYGLPLIISRSSNVYGPRQDKTKLIPKFITQLLSGKKAPLYARGQHIRTWLYVEDAVEAIDKIYRKGKLGEIYNIGGVSELTNLAVTKLILDQLQKKNSDISYVADRPGHDFRYALSNKKITKALGWKPKTNFSDGIKKTIEFYAKR